MSSGEFNKQAHNALEDAIRILVKWLEMAVKGLFEFIRYGIHAVLGK